VSETQRADALPQLRAELQREQRKHTFGEEQRKAQAIRLAELKEKIEAAAIAKAEG